MGLFNKLGRRFEQFKQNAKSIADEQATYECQDCGERFHTEYEECPECGSDTINTRADSE